jgi:hypothetical protein
MIGKVTRAVRSDHKSRYVLLQLAFALFVIVGISAAVGASETFSSASIRGIKADVHFVPGVYRVTAYCVGYWHVDCPPCPPKALCEPCYRSSVYFADRDLSGRAAVELDRAEDTVRIDEGRLGSYKGKLAVGRQYQIVFDILTVSGEKDWRIKEIREP